ncbi:uncharacterized protein LOC125722632 [Brienomyrus brachyistius]|uniref:uncharacterized protein LOC125722632 n=1 Tax=Brienomyrus brachyistius TaxID=42636 RepID=UPI0020B3DDBD|nr:uncharacterized protein LOC125722632 [Brienomyrus brachyistius]
MLKLENREPHFTALRWKTLTIQEKVKLLDVLREGKRYADGVRHYGLNESTVRYMKKDEKNIKTIHRLTGQSHSLLLSAGWKNNSHAVEVLQTPCLQTIGSLVLVYIPRSSTVESTFCFTSFWSRPSSQSPRSEAGVNAAKSFWSRVIRSSASGLTGVPSPSQILQNSPWRAKNWEMQSAVFPGAARSRTSTYVVASAKSSGWYSQAGWHVDIVARRIHSGSNTAKATASPIS